ncbi:hypothetical protein [Tumebacillus permanentifrigoris]|uniref:Uncharacterized protein n=1 Tax=Tumebacillus permanentifrigoris TaxID=378543 RepID=A0A316D850_9BACL|nr:hypothetical protein [Tumebacillus permanentifrigoris]PWK11611.1 hypothetical protein C7459_110140 [Tumebacillus permanentifrigoris]
MKNERIITHFQSYTTAKGCVKDLTPYFKERISVLTPQSGLNAGQTHKTDDRDDLTKLADGGIGTAQTMISDLAEIGGVALGTVAYLYPGMSPILTGGPMAGDAIGQNIGSYMLAELGTNYSLEDEDQQRGSSTSGGQGGTWSRAGNFADQNTSPRNQSVFIAVDVHSEHEAMIVERIMLQYGGKPHRGTSSEPDGGFPSYETLPANPGVESHYSFAQPDSTIPEEYRNPALEGYPLDPIAPLSPQGFIDRNIGLGDYNLADPNATVGLPPRE